MGMDRRGFLTATGAGLAASSLLGATGAAARQATPSAVCSDEVLRPLPAYSPRQQYRIGYTTNTRGGWEGDPFKGMAEARDVGFRYMEIFGASFGAPPAGSPGAAKHDWGVYYPDDAEGLMRRTLEMGVQFVSITGGAPGGPTDFENAGSREAVIRNHFEMARFSRKFGTTVWKTNLGRRRPEGTTSADLKEMALTCNELGRGMLEQLGMRFGIHPHLGSQLQSEREVHFMMENTDARYVGLILDTGHITMAGMDPLALAKRYGMRVLEFHLKDVAPRDRGGAKVIPGPTVDMMKTPYFFPLGSGGVDFLALKRHLDGLGWRGFLNVELDTSPSRPPRESARMSARYIENVLKIPL